MISDETLDLLVRNEADMSFRRRVRTVFEWLDPQDGDHILDGGCGRGFYLKFIRHVSNCKLTGLEFEYPYLRIAHAELHGSGITLINGSLYQLPFPDNTFHKIILSEVLEHLEDDVGGLRELVRVLKPGGLVAVTVPNANYPFWWDPLNKTLEAAFNMHIRRGLLAGIWANHVRLYERKELRRVAQEAGLEVLAERSFTHHSMPFMHNIVYGFGKTVLEAGLLPSPMATAADRYRYQENEGSLLNPVNLALRVLLFFDRRNVREEPEGRSTVNLCLKGRKPHV
jgi:ubiquinone/menaquinone biosynthesis C-methylase UbiE